MSIDRVWVHCPRCRASYPEGYLICPGDHELLVTSSVDPLLGAILDDRYRIEAMIGGGLLGRVYRARHTRVPRLCAVKVAEERSLIQGRATQRLLNEAEAGGRLDHPNVVAVLDRGELAPGQPYLVMELADGEALRVHVTRGNGVDVNAALALALQLALGLEHAHERGLVHRDLTPDNVIVGAGGRARIVDFGLALVLDSDAPRCTGAGLVIGTPPFMAPEQTAGDPIDARADLYSLGMILSWMIARPDRVVGALLDRMVAYRPGDRIGSAAEVVAELEAVIARRAVADPEEWVEVPTARSTPLSLHRQGAQGT